MSFPTMDEKPEVCPTCGSERVAEIRDGLPEFSEELVRALDAGELVLGGCVITGDDRAWHCVDCSHRWSEWDDPNQCDEHDGLPGSWTGPALPETRGSRKGCRSWRSG
jgi:hypothetical protein